MNPILSEQLPSDPETQQKVRRNHLVATQVMQLMVKRHRKLEPEAAFEAVANTIGIVCAEFTLDAYGIAGPELAKAMRDLINHHMDRAIAATSPMPGPEKGH